MCVSTAYYYFCYDADVSVILEALIYSELNRKDAARFIFGMYVCSIISMAI